MSVLWVLQEGEELFVPGSAGGPFYWIRMRFGVLTCTCPAWVGDCKHIRENVDLSHMPVPDLDVVRSKIDWSSRQPVQTDSGLYRIVCSANKRFYIGETSSFKERWKNHQGMLRQGARPQPYFHRGRFGHHNGELQADYSLFGGEAFTFHPYQDISNGVERRAAEESDIRINLGPACYNKPASSPPGIWVEDRKRKKEDMKRNRERVRKEYEEILEAARLAGTDVMTESFRRMCESIRTFDEVAVAPEALDRGGSTLSTSCADPTNSTHPFR